MLSPPDIMGLFTYTKTHKNFNLVLKDATGKFSSFSGVSTCKLTAKPPFDPTSLVFERNKIIATAEGRFVDVWEKVQ